MNFWVKYRKKSHYHVVQMLFFHWTIWIWGIILAVIIYVSSSSKNETLCTAYGKWLTYFIPNIMSTNTHVKKVLFRMLCITFRFYLNYALTYIQSLFSFVIGQNASDNFRYILKPSACNRAFAHDVTAAMLVFQFKIILIRLFCLEHQHGRHGFCWVGPWGMSANVL
jgi:hypothetical protein